jgi:hypothetical protein
MFASLLKILQGNLKIKQALTTIDHKNVTTRRGAVLYFFFAILCPFLLQNTSSPNNIEFL